MNTVLCVNVTIGFSENLFLVKRLIYHKVNFGNASSNISLQF